MYTSSSRNLKLFCFVLFLLRNLSDDSYLLQESVKPLPEQSWWRKDKTWEMDQSLSPRSLALVARKGPLAPQGCPFSLSQGS